MPTHSRNQLWWLLPVFLLFVFVPTLVRAQSAVPTPPPPAGDWSRVKSAGKVIVGTAANYAPFEYYNSSFQLEGFDISLMRELTKRMGVEAQFQDYAFEGLLDALQLGQIDLAIAAISVTPDRQQLVDFSNVYYFSNDAALVRDDFSKQLRSAVDFKDLKIGVERGSTFNAWAQQNIVDKGLTAQANLKTYEDMNSIVRDLRNGTIDAALLESLAADSLLQRVSGLRIGGSKFNVEQLAIAARKGSSLIEKINQALVSSQADGSFAKIVGQYLTGNNGSNPSATPTIIPPVPTVGPAPTSAPVPKPPCYYGMTLESHLNLDDHNMAAPPVMAPGQEFTKAWRVRNSGTCPWTGNFMLSYVNGSQAEARMGGANKSIGRRVEPGQQTDLSVKLRAPKGAGYYQGFWQLSNGDQQPFGQMLPVGIQVPQPVPTPTPVPQVQNPNLRADAIEVAAGQCTTLRWDVDNVVAVYLVDGGNVQGVGGHDARTVCPGKTTTYRLRVVDRNNKTTEYKITIKVIDTQNVKISFTSDRNTINAGECTKIRWSVENVNSVYFNNEGVAGVSSRDVCPGKTTDYHLRVILRNGAEEKRNLRITVVGAPPPPPPGRPIISQFYGNPNVIASGQCVNFSWRTSGAQGINFYRSGIALLQAGPTSGGLQDCPGTPGIYDYTLDAYNNADHTSQAVTVQVR